MITGEYEELKKLAETHTCSCGGKLTVAWGGAFGVSEYILRCARDIKHDKLSGHDKERERIKREVAKMDNVSLTTMPETQIMERVNMAKFPKDLTMPEKQMLVKAAKSYGLDPLMGEITIYQGNLYVSIDGRYRMAQETDMLDGVETRPATDEERSNWKIPEGDYFFRSEVFKKGCSRPFVGWGRVLASETQIKNSGDAYKPIVKNPQRMAEKRAEAQALRKAFNINLPSAEDIPEYEYTEAVYRVVDETVQDAPQSTQSEPEQSEQGNTQGSLIKDVNVPQNAGELAKWVLSHGKKYDATWTCQQLNVSRLDQVENFETAVAILKEITGWE